MPIMKDQHGLHQPLLPTIITTATTTTSTSSLHANEARDTNLIPLSNCSIIIRLLMVLFIGTLSLWANFEASKGFEITIINDAKHTPAGQYFTLFYVSNDKATRIVLNTSEFVENLLYPNNNHHFPKKVVHHVTLRLATHNFTHKVTNYQLQHDYVININPLVFEDYDVNYAMVSSVQRSMARIWLYDGESSAPPTLLDGLVEYITMVAGFVNVKDYDKVYKLPELCDQKWWEDKDPRVVAHLLGYFEEQQKGFIQRLNQAMKDRWEDRMVEDTLGMPAQHLCGSSYNSSKNNQLSNFTGF
ncbi:uncharacterized protein LOC115957467 [Quercus lobata]|uniref:Uncharacterized protein n=1 Tax=Quercus lobata TaxID=97700 RepID=A0A7N2MCX7_QUELO|nr:uncharacterized protein LOC115957467 [Quercus lobata]